MSTHTPNHRRPRRPPGAAKRPLVRYLLLGALVGVLMLAVAGAVLIATRSTDTLSASASPPSTSASTQSPGPIGLPVASIDTEVGFGPKRVTTVSEQVALDRPVASLTLTVNKAMTSVSGGVFRPRINSLLITSANQPPLNVSRTIEPGDRFTIALPHPARRFTLAYAASGAVRRSEPSSAHRALAVVALVTVVAAEDTTNTINISGENVTNIGCIEPSGTAVTCGSRTADGWTVTQNSGDQETAVLAQLDLHR